MNLARNKYSLHFLFLAVWGIVLGLSISHYGLGISTDSVEYLFASQNYLHGYGLVTYDNSPYYLWPPLYPILLAFIQLVGVGPFASAHILQFVAFGLIAYFSTYLFLKIFRDRSLAFLGVFLFQTSTVVSASFQMVGTDYLFALFPILLALLSARYQDKQDWKTVLLIGLIASLAMSLRYIGYTLVLTALLLVYAQTNGSTLKRIQRIIPVGLCAVPPLGWMVYTWMATAGQRRAPLTLFEYIKQIVSGTMDWFTPIPPVQNINPIHILLVFLPLLGLVMMAFRNTHVFTVYTTPVLLFGAIYFMCLLLNASIAYFNRLTGRFLLPMYLPELVLVLLMFQAQVRATLSKGILSLFIIILAALQMGRTMELMRASINGEIPYNAYNTKEWNENKALLYWKANIPGGDYILLSNYQAGVAFHTGHVTLPSPRRTEIYGTEIIPLQNYTKVIFKQGYETYLIWIEPNQYKHVYEPLELLPLAKVEIIFKHKDGAVFRLRLK